MKWLRLLVRVLLAVAVFLVLAALVVLGPLREWSTDLVRQQGERILAAALHTPVAVGSLRVSFLPPRVEADAVVLGPDGALARAARITVRLLPRTSLRQMRPVAEATVDDVVVDVPRWVTLFETPEPSEPPGARPALPVASSARPLGEDPSGAGWRAARLERRRGHRRAGGRRQRAPAFLGRRRAGRVGAARRRAAARPGAPARWRDAGRLAAHRCRGAGRRRRAGQRGAGRRPAARSAVVSICQRLAFASDVFERMRGEAEVDVALIGRLDQPAAAGTVRVAEFAFDGERVGDVTATADWNQRTLTVSGRPRRRRRRDRPRRAASSP